jgi:circadian clock protein KaiC
MEQVEERISSGIEGLDEILNGGLVPQRTYLIRGGPGAGKSTLGLHFLHAGAMKGEKVLYITLEESQQGIMSNNVDRGFAFSAINFLDISPSSEFFAQNQSYDIFSPAEVEREPVTNKIIEEIERIKPTRVFIDPMTQFRYFTLDVFQFRKQVLSFLKYLVERGTTVMFSSESSLQTPDDDLQFMSDGIIDLSCELSGRWISLLKMRGTAFRSGRHAMQMDNGGLVVYPHLIPSIQDKDFNFEVLSTGIPDLDKLLHGGIERGTVTIITGPSGVGKTTIGTQIMKEAANRGEGSILYTFEEEIELILERCDNIGITARQMVKKKTLQIYKIEPLQYSADEFAWHIRHDVEKSNARIVMIDSISGYKMALRDENLQSCIHAISKYLQNIGVAVIIINEVESITGDFRITEDRFSHIADNIIFMRYLEIDGEMRKAIGVLKKRLSNFEKRLREFEIDDRGIKVGEPFKGLRGILAGIPEFIEKN